MPRHQKKGARTDQRWIQKPNSGKTESTSDATEMNTAATTEGINNGIGRLAVVENSARSSVPVPQFGSIKVDDVAHLHGLSNVQSHVSAGPSPVTTSNSIHGKKYVYKPKSYGTVSGATTVDSAKPSAAQTAALRDLFKKDLLESFNVDNSTYTTAKIRATFYPKFENEKSDQEVRTRMIEMVSKGLATLEVSLKHSGSLFMYAGHEGGAYAKNSFGNVYTAVGVFVLGRIFRKAWGTEASKKQAEFNEFLEREHMSISMELVTAVLGDHGQRPREDYVVVTAITELGNGKPKFYSTPEIIAFCRQWRLPTNHIWLLSTRNAVTSFFAAYDALCEEGTATSVCKALDEVADISVPGSIDHVKVQGEILEGLVARIVSHESTKHMELVLQDYPSPIQEVDQDGGPGLREICAANRSDEKQQIKALLENVGTSFCPNYVDWFGFEEADIPPRNADRSVVSKFLQAKPSDHTTFKLKEMVRVMKEKRFPAAFKCYHNFHKINSISSDNLHYKMVIHVHSDSTFRRYQKEMRYKPDLWPLYRGFFVEINMFKASKDKAAEISKNTPDVEKNYKDDTKQSDLADEDANLMIKLKFLTYKLRTFLIRNGLSILFKEGPAAYKTYYLRQMKIWNTSPGKQRQLSKMLDEWAVYIRRKYGHKQLSSSIYLTEAEPFLEQYAKRSPENQALIGCAGDLVRTEDFLAIVEGGRDEEEDDLNTEKVLEPSGTKPDAVRKKEGLIVFFPGIPGCAKSGLCKEILSGSKGLDDDRPVHSLMGDLIKGRYWPKVADERRKKPYSIVLADKNAPNEEVWRQIEDMCRTTKASAVPIVPDSEGTESNPFSLDALAVFIYRVLNRVNHPGNLDKSSPNVGFVLLMFYHLYDGKNRSEFDSELIERFGSLIKMPLLKSERHPLPDSVKTILEEGLNLYRLHTNRHGRLESTKGTYIKEWVTWEKRLREVLSRNSNYLTSIQVPFEVAVNHVVSQLNKITRGEYEIQTPTSEKRKFGTIVFAAIDVPLPDIHNLLSNMAMKEPKVKAFLENKNMEEKLKKAHITLAHKKTHGVTAVANYGQFVNQKVPVEVGAVLFSDKLAALEVNLGSIDGQQISCRNEWPHVTLWTAEGVPPKEANLLPQLVLEGKATRVDINPPFRVNGVLQFH